MSTQFDRRSFLGALAASAAAASVGGPARASGLGLVPQLREPMERSSVMSTSLWHAASRSGRFFGTATTSDRLAADRAYAANILRDCDVITPEWQLKWNAIEYAPGAFNFPPVDALLQFARANGKSLRGHTLLWDQSTPDWAKQAMLGTRDWSIVARYFGAVLGRYGRAIEEWDVVNEPIDTQTGIGGLRTNAFYRAYGPGYIDRALRQARALAPGARLMINDYGFEYANQVDEARRETFLALLRSLKAAGSPLDGVGIQAHLDLSKGAIPVATLQSFYRSIADLGLFIVVTELDVKEMPSAASLAARDEAVAEETARYLAIALAERAVRGVVTWGLSDKYSWLDIAGATGAAINRGLPYDAQLDPKRMYYAIGRSFQQSR